MTEPDRAAEERIRTGMQLIWQQSLPALRVHLSEIELCCRELEGRSEPALQHRENAAAAAHKLAGVMGMFGYPEGTLAARSIEQLLSSAHTTGPALLASITPHLLQLRTELYPPASL